MDNINGNRGRKDEDRKSRNEKSGDVYYSKSVQFWGAAEVYSTGARNESSGSA